MEATFSLSHHFYTKPIFTPHVHRIHVDHSYYRQPTPPPPPPPPPRSFALQSWPTPLRTHRLTWAVDVLPGSNDHVWFGGQPLWPSSQGEAHCKAWAVNSFPTQRKSNGGDDARAWATAFITMTAVAACVAGAAFGMRGVMVAPPAIAAFCPALPSKDVVASDELKEFLLAHLLHPSAKQIEDATKRVYSRLSEAAGSQTDYLSLKEDARVVIVSGKGKEMMEMLKKKFEEESKLGGDNALQLGLIYLEMLILQVKPDEALSFLDSGAFQNVRNQMGSDKESRTFLYKAAAKLLSGSPEGEVKEAWNEFANAEELRGGPYFESMAEKLRFEDLRKSMAELERRRRHPHFKMLRDKVRSIKPNR